MEPKYELGKVIVELTRRCNMKCRHCMRGPAQPRDMSVKVMDAVIGKIAGLRADAIVLGGGESTTVPKLVRKFFRKTVDAGIYPGHYGITTNGKAMPPEFMRAVADIQNNAEVYIMTSFDDCHDRVDYDKFIERCDRLKKVTAEADRFHRGVNMMFRYGSDRYDNDVIRTEKHDRHSVIRMGRGASVYGGCCAVTVDPYNLVDDSESSGVMPLGEDDFYIDVDGNVWPHCDLSYRFMRVRRKYCLGNVTDPGFDWYRAAVRFNLKFAKEFPLKLMEPGYDDFGYCNPEDHFRSNTERYIKKTMEVAEQIGLR